MRSTLFEDFDKRAQEVRRYFIFLKNLEKGSIQLSLGNANNPKIKPINEDLEKTLKATGYLLLYNLVESTMRNAIVTIFDELKTQRVSFDDVRDEIKKIVIDNLKDKDNKSTKDILVTVQNISVDIISATFNRDRLFSGNIDGKRIKDTAKMYGFSYTTNAGKTGNGSNLEKIKNHRKDLAHGFKSFEEIGKDATADELFKIQKRVICYLREILENIEMYISNQEYLQRNEQNSENN
ncbi:MAE_28990/MAE_18760 family HEPN-like nuclease [Dolichospermum sp. ST_con]|nr:MAE_28990/MAE_18760 family HEPN-like nuclease [Dolichospermum sp. ST_con]MDD1421618.1 MAE_28990/MAE_18760 family HEPN-like nuclease [Dolichospermum sp. ST_sed1]MDD1427009.1 MAE_28990/MAE_18760 family HEPN-like nuclease [Dolichospermum sp. ST_sed9]MDD1433593.1 MAE_28990/MAE_18760 family HEPN-like nuclease [Dolichospermum sp. ST_sed6]MDD1436761.1 MAE_28990/MAE_18760 family HEPN-like nuclease [Dolichospermum sp. ST_sed10]MDD1442813.1 MAE_28990/MAE_18760 family HEPN-like nuclease [Dolichospermu